MAGDFVGVGTPASGSGAIKAIFDHLGHRRVTIDMPTPNPKTGEGAKKPDTSLIPSPALMQLAAVMMLGARKYGPSNWRETEVPARTYISAAERHLRSWLDGEEIDPESGCSHLAHAMACCAILIDAIAVGKMVDNRPAAAPTAEMIRRFAATGSFSSAAPHASQSA